MSEGCRLGLGCRPRAAKTGATSVISAWTRALSNEPKTPIATVADDAELELTFDGIGGAFAGDLGPAPDLRRVIDQHVVDHARVLDVGDRALLQHRHELLQAGAVGIDLVGAHGDGVLVDGERLVQQQELDGLLPGIDLVLVDVGLGGHKSLRDDLAVRCDKARRVAGVGRVDLLFVEQALALEHVEVGAALKRQYRGARLPDVGHAREVPLGVAPEEDLRVLGVPGQHRLGGLGGGRADLLVGTDHAQQNAVILVHLRGHGLEPDGRTAGPDLEVDAGVRRAGRSTCSWPGSMRPFAPMSW